MKIDPHSISFSFQFQPGLATLAPSPVYIPAAINDFGQIVGDFTLRGPSTAFLYENGTVNTGIVPGITGFSHLGGINDFGRLAGWINSPGGSPAQAILVTNGTVRTFTYPGSLETIARGINNLGQVVGSYSDGAATHGFVGTPEHLRSFDVPGGSDTVAYAINDWGQIAGSYSDAAGDEHGFLATRGQYVSINVPGARATWATGINDWGQIVGYYADTDNQTHGYVLTHGHFQTLDAPDAAFTQAAGINNLGQIVGWSQSGSRLETQTWVATPRFMHDNTDGPDFAGAGSPLASLSEHQDTATLLRAIAGAAHDPHFLGLIVGDAEGAPNLPGEIAGSIAAVLSPWDWTGIPGSHDGWPAHPAG